MKSIAWKRTSSSLTFTTAQTDTQLAGTPCQSYYPEQSLGVSRSNGLCWGGNCYVAKGFPILKRSYRISARTNWDNWLGMRGLTQMAYRLLKVWFNYSWLTFGIWFFGILICDFYKHVHDVNHNCWLDPLCGQKNRFSGNVVSAVVFSLLCSIRYTTESERSENDELDDLVASTCKLSARNATPWLTECGDPCPVQDWD